MKTKLMLVVIVILGVFTSCQKDEMVEISEEVIVVSKSVNDTKENRAIVAALPLMTESEVRSNLGLVKTKSASATEGNDVSIFALNSNETIFFGDSVRRFSAYVDKGDNGYRDKYYTFSQTYFIKDGFVNPNSFSFDFQYGCPQSRIMYLTKVSNVSNLRLFFIQNDGKTFFYNLDTNYNNEVRIAPFANGYWVASGITDDGDLSQIFVSKPIDPYSDNQNISMEIQIQEPNVKYFVGVNKYMLKDIEYILLFGEDNNGNTITRFHPVIYKDNMPVFLSYGASFNIQAIQLCGKNGCQWYSTDNMKLVVDLKGIQTYYLE